MLDLRNSCTDMYLFSPLLFLDLECGGEREAGEPRQQEPRQHPRTPAQLQHPRFIASQ